MLKSSLFKYLGLILGIVVLTTALTACSTIDPYTGEQQVSKTAIGTGVGAVGGAIVGGLIGGRTGALVGAAAGGMTGAMIGSSVDSQDAELRERLVGTGVQVQRIGNGIQLCMASDVTFKTNSSDINSNFYPTLNSVAVILQKYDNTNIEISGFTDNTGTPAYNQELSERRAQSVGDFLASQGVNPNRIFTQGFGQRHPVASNKTTHGKSLNRRVTIMLRPR